MRRRSADDALDLESLYRHNREDVYAYVVALLRDRSAAEEVTAAAFERVLTRRESYTPERGSARAWLFGIARNAAYDELRRLGRTRPVSDPLPAASPDDDPTAEAGVRRASLAAALAELEPDERELIALKFEAGLANGEIGALLAISESNVGTRLSRVVAKLRARMA